MNIYNDEIDQKAKKGPKQKTTNGEKKKILKKEKILSPRLKQGQGSVITNDNITHVEEEKKSAREIPYLYKIDDEEIISRTPRHQTIDLEDELIIQRNSITDLRKENLDIVDVDSFSKEKLNKEDEWTNSLKHKTIDIEDNELLLSSSTPNHLRYNFIIHKKILLLVIIAIILLLITGLILIISFWKLEFFQICLFNNSNCHSSNNINEPVITTWPSPPPPSSNIIDELNMMCESMVFDKDGECCEMGEVDGCGICNSTGNSIDIFQNCCDYDLTAEGKCCLGRVALNGVCNGVYVYIIFEGRLYVRETEYLNSAFMALGIPKRQVGVYVEPGVTWNFYTFDELYIGPNVTNTVPLPSKSECPHKLPICESLPYYEVEANNEDVDSIEFVIANHNTNIDRKGLYEIYDMPSFERIEEILLILNNCYCGLLNFDINSIKMANICGNGECEYGEVCNGTNSDTCCPDDCIYELIDCPIAIDNDQMCGGHGHGTCDYEIGECICWQGFSGHDCMTCNTTDNIIVSESDACVPLEFT